MFSGRQIADNLGNLLGPLAFGLLAFAIGFRAPLFLVAVLAAVVAVLSFRLKEPRKGAQGAGLAGASGFDLDIDDETLGLRDADRVCRVGRHDPAAVALDPVPVRRGAGSS